MKGKNYLYFGISFVIVIVCYLSWLLITHWSRPIVFFYNENNPPSKKQIEWVADEFILKSLSEPSFSGLKEFRTMGHYVKYLMDRGKLAFLVRPVLGKIEKIGLGRIAQTQKYKDIYIISWSAAFILNISEQYPWNNKKITRQFVAVAWYHEMLHILMKHPDDCTAPLELRHKNESIVHFRVIKDILRPLRQQGENLFPLFPDEEIIDKALRNNNDDPLNPIVIEKVKSLSN